MKQIYEVAHNGIESNVSIASRYFSTKEKAKQYKEKLIEGAALIGIIIEQSNIYITRHDVDSTDAE